MIANGLKFPYEFRFGETGVYMDPPRVTVAAARMMMITKDTSPMWRNSPGQEPRDRRGDVLIGLLGAASSRRRGGGPCDGRGRRGGGRSRSGDGPLLLIHASLGYGRAYFKLLC